MDIRPTLIALLLLAAGQPAPLLAADPAAGDARPAAGAEAPAAGAEAPGAGAEAPGAGAAAPGAGAEATSGVEQSAAQPSDFSKARLDYGRYLARAGDCVACHTRPGGKPFEGGLGIDTPFGTIYTPNITPAKGDGIGDFSDEDFLRALQHGIRPDGKPYYPALPYPSFTKVDDDDLLAIKDYLSTLEPSSYRPPRTRLRWPFDDRDLLFGWQAVYFEPGRLVPDPSKSDEWNRGAYLVEGLGHCGACHTPRNFAGATKQRDALTGAFVDGWYAPDLTSDLSEGVGKWSVDALAEYLHSGLAPAAGSGDGPQTAALGPMAEVVHDSLSKLALSDLRAIAVYLKDRPARPAPREQAPVPERLSAKTYATGRRLYEDYCSACHQRYGQGLAPYFPALRGNEAVTQQTPDDVLETLLLGAPANPADAYSRHVVMPSFGTVLNDAQIAALASFIRASWGNDAAPVTAEEVAAARARP